MAITTSWNTASSGNWDGNSPSYWSNGVPNATDTTANIALAGTYTVTINGGETFTVGTLNLTGTNATVQDNGDLVVDAAAAIAGIFDANGTLDLSAGATATVTGKLILQNADVIGGTLTGAGTIQTTRGDTATFDGTVAGGLTIANSTKINVVDGSVLSFGGPANTPSTITNDGTITLNANSGQSTLSINEDVTLTGGGNIVLSDAGNGNNAILSYSGGGVLDNVNNTISGAGTISSYAGLTITNETAGTIDANSTAFPLTDNGVNITNTGTVEATAGGALNLNNMTLNDTGTGLLQAAGAGSTVTLNNTTVQGGTLTTTGSGIITTGNGNTSTFTLSVLAGTTMVPSIINTTGSTVEVADNSALNLNGQTGTGRTGVLANDGTISLGAATNNSTLGILNHVELTGGGIVQLSDAGNGINYIQGQTGASTLENFNNTIEGAGTIQNYAGLSVTNDAAGVIDANSNIFGLTINGITVTNAGLVEATGTAGLSLTNMTLNNSGTTAGTLEAGTGSFVALNSSTVEGGTLTTSGSGLIETNNGTNYFNLTASTNGAVNISSGSTVAVANNTALRFTGLTGIGRAGIMNNAGTIEETAGANTTVISIDNNVKLTGGGNITLSDSTNNQILSYQGGSSLENVNNTISGAGLIQNYAGLAITNDAGGTLESTYADNALNISTNLVNAGTLEAAAGSKLALSGTDTLGGTVTGGTGGTVAVAGTSTFNSLALSGGVTLDIDAALGNTTGGVTFSPSSTATLEFDAPVLGSGGGTLLNPIANFATGQTIDLSALAFVGGNTPTYNSATQTLTVTEGSVTDTLHLTTPAGMMFQAKADATGGTDVTVMCFAQGTAIRTAHGDVAVEALAVGDTAVTAAGRGRPIRWIGKRSLDCTAHQDPAMVRPIRVAAGAFGGGRPYRDLLLSPHHAVAVGSVDEVLVPIRLLVNGTTIAQLDDVDQVTYWHVELDSHDVILANGLPAESYIDVGNRCEFEGEASLTLHPLFKSEPLAGYCRPFVTGGAVLAAIRAQLAGDAGAAPAETAAPSFHLLVAGERIAPVVCGQQAAFVVPPGDHDVRLVSPTWSPCEIDPASADDRRLGLMIEALSVDDLVGGITEVPLQSRALVAGFHPLESGPLGTWRWTGGDALLSASLFAGRAGPRVLRLTGQFTPPTAALRAEALAA